MTGIYSGIGVLAGLAAVATTSLPPTEVLSGWERIGAAAIALSLMWYFLQRESKERERLTRRAEEINDRMLQVLQKGSDAIAEVAAANADVAAAIRNQKGK